MMASESINLSLSTKAEEKIWTPRKRAWLMFRNHKPAIISLAILIFLIIIVAFAPYIAPYEFDQVNFKNTKSAPTSSHIMGTDDLGRDMFTRILYGGRISLLIGFSVAVVGTFVGATIGSIAGFYGKGLDNMLMRFTDIAYSIPSLPLMIVLSAYTKSSIPFMILVIGFLSWMPMARVVRAQVLSLKENEYVTAAYFVGVSNAEIILRHILPNTLGPIIVGATLSVGSAIIIESSLSFLGLGVMPPTPSWGNMLQDSQRSMVSQPWLTIFPGMAILVTVLCINFLGDGMRDAFDPTLAK
jgi:peptide/nickel transport system permease protein